MNARPDFIKTDRGGCDFIPADTEAGRLARSIDWAGTPLGDPAGWSPVLRMMVPFVLANRFPHLLWWGPDYIQIYNGLSLGIVALGGMAIGAGLALGGAAIGAVAIGGAAAGHYACGGGAIGTHTVSGMGADPQAVAFFQRWFPWAVPSWVGR